MKHRYNPVLVAVIAVGLVCALWLNWQRHQVEQANNTVEMAMEYEGLRKLAILQGLSELPLQKAKEGAKSAFFFLRSVTYFNIRALA